MILVLDLVCAFLQSSISGDHTIYNGIILYTYHIVGNFGEVFNLAIWLNRLRSPN